MTSASNSLTVREGLIQIVSAERFQAKPRSGGNIQVVVMQKVGGALRHYKTLRHSNDDLSIGEKIWGDFVCYIVKLDRRTMKIDQEFSTLDHITNVRIKCDVAYQVVDAELVAVGFDDALQSMQDEIITLLKRQIARSSHDAIDEAPLESYLHKQSGRFSSWVGIQILQIRISTELDRSVVDRLRQDRQRKHDAAIEDENRRRKHQLELEDIKNVDKVLHQLGMQGLPGDARLKLLSMPREKAFEKIGEYIQEQRSIAQNFAVERAKQEYEMLNKLIERGILEDFDLQDFGKTLLKRYSKALAFQEILGAPPEILLGSSSRPILEEDKRSKDTKKLQTKDDDTEQE